jgi:type I restriction enzyme R subunit
MLRTTKSRSYLPIRLSKPREQCFFAVSISFSIVGKTNAVLILSFTSTEYLWCFWTEKLVWRNTTSEAFNQIQHYCKDIPLLFEYNALTIVSDGNEAQHGMFNSSTEWYAAWKSIDRVEIVEDDFQMHSLLFGLFLKTVYCPTLRTLSLKTITVLWLRRS